MKKPMFSVIIPTLNEEKFVGNLLASLVAQTQKDFEVIVVDGKSKDKTIQVVERYKVKLPSIRIVESEKKNTGAQRNLGASVAYGNWLVFVDADSTLFPYFFDRVSAYIHRNKARALTTRCRSDSELRGDALLALFSNMTVELSMKFRRPLAPGPLTIVHCRAHQAIRGYDEEYRNTEDVDYGRRLFDAGYPLHIIRETLYVWSLRRFRREGTLAIVQRFAITSLLVLITRKPQKFITGYDLGGALYTLKKTTRLSLVRKYEKKIRKLLYTFIS